MGNFSSSTYVFFAFGLYYVVTGIIELVTGKVVGFSKEMKGISVENAKKIARPCGLAAILCGIAAIVVRVLGETAGWNQYLVTGLTLFFLLLPAIMLQGSMNQAKKESKGDEKK